MAASWMETYKKTEKKSTQKSTSLRKSLSGLSEYCENETFFLQINHNGIQLESLGTSLPLR